MRAAVFHGPHDVRIESVADPAAPAAGEVVLEVLRAAICGTDASEWDHGPILCRPGVVLGHEFVGRVVECGDHTTFDVGDRVVSGAGISCGHCRWCLGHRTNLCAEYRTLGLQVNGGLAEYVTSPAAICRPVPVSCDDDAAAMAQPVAVALHALSRVGLAADESVAVIGTGGIGSFVVAGAARRAAFFFGAAFLAGALRAAFFGATFFGAAFLAEGFATTVFICGFAAAAFGAASSTTRLKYRCMGSK